MKEKIIVYCGVTISHQEARDILPEAILRPPIQHSDLITDLHRHHPTHVLIIDGKFREVLSVWQKEIIFALQFPGVQRIYGASSMGALRAAELADFGMIPVGKIANWYLEGVIEDDDEVAVSYTEKLDEGETIYTVNTVPMVNIRATILANEDWQYDQNIFDSNKNLHFSERYKTSDQIIDQKKLDAIELLSNFRSYEPLTTFRPSYQHISPLFLAQHERDRRIICNGVEMQAGCVDTYISLNSMDYSRMQWDASNRTLALILADLMGITVETQDILKETARFMVKMGINTIEQYNEWLSLNATDVTELNILQTQNARIRKLQGALNTSFLHRRRTRIMSDYLRTSGDYQYWAQEAAIEEHKLQLHDIDVTMSLDPSENIHKVMSEHLSRTGQTLDGGLGAFISECGFHSTAELYLSVVRSKLAGEL